MSEREMETKHDICLSCKLPNEAYFTVVKLDAGQIVGRSLSTNCSTKTQIQDNLFLATTFLCLRGNPKNEFYSGR